jgi:dihydrofolate reductase
MIVSCIVAMAHNNVIGLNNQMPWHLPADLKHFKSITLSKPVLMGRKTFESIGRPLPGRQNIVISRNPDWKHDHVIRVSSLNEGLKQAKPYAEDSQEIMVIGGGQIYEEAIGFADRLYITEIELEAAGDAFFPKIDKSIWEEKEREAFSAVDDKPAYSFVTYERRA